MADKGDFAARYGPWVIVAGASEGIGAAYAEQLASRNLDLILIGRRAERLGYLVSRLSQNYDTKIRSIVLDLSAPDAAEQVLRETSEMEVGLLVYNAAFSGLGDMTLKPEQVVREALDALGNQPYVIPGRMNRVANFVMRHLLPRKTAIKFMGRVLRKMYLK